MKRLGWVVFISLISALSAVGIYKLFDKPDKIIYEERIPAHYTKYNKARSDQPPLSFSYAAAITTPTVVHIKTTIMRQSPGSQQYQQLPEPFRDFFGQPPAQGPQPVVASGSGVIISDDGYIVTNNHVVEEGEKIEVVLHDKRSYTAEMVGVDPTTDLALIKISASDLPFIKFGNSDSTLVGDWVLAVGNPFNLSSTVTAGIVSAKARNIQILKERAAIESFIQTDAVVNKGNSGGALVNLDGELIGINTAIATPTGTYAGYAFAVPVNIVQKVIEDLAEFGVVQRGFLGVTIRNINSQLAEELDLDVVRRGVYIDSVMAGSAAKEAGLKKGDVILQVNDVTVQSVAELQEQLAQYRPGDKVRITYLRDDDREATRVELKNIEGTTKIVEKKETEVLDELGIQMRNITDEELQRLGIEGGVIVTDIGRGKIGEQTRMREGFIIMKVDEKEIDDIEELRKVLQKKKGKGVMVEGIYPGYPSKFYYAFGL